MDNLIMKQQEHAIYYENNTMVISLLQHFCFDFGFRTWLKM